MALVVYDRVQQTGTANTTVSFTLGGSVTGYQSFSVVGNGNTTFYAATDTTGNWEVGVGTYATGGTLTRTTILSSSNSGSAVTFSGTCNVFVTYPSEKSVNLDASGNVTALGTISSAVWNGTTIPVAYGGTGVTTSTGASSVVLRDANVNVTANNFLAGYNVITAAAGTTVLTVSSAYYQRISGSTTQTIQLPIATTLVQGQGFVFDNDSSGAVSIVDSASGAIDTVPSGGYSYIFAEDVTTSAGSWGKYALLPASYDFSTTSANFGSAVISNTTYQGTAVASGYGGTGLTTFTAANNAIYSTSASALAAGTLPVLAGGTGVTTSTGTGSVVLGTRPTLAVTGTGLTLQDATDNTKTANFVLSGLTTATNYSYTLPAVTGSSLATLGNIAQTFTGATSFLPTTAASTLTIGGTAGTGTITLGQSTATQTVNIANAAVASGQTATVNIGNAGLTGSTTTINIGVANTANTNLYGGFSSAMTTEGFNVIYQTSGLIRFGALSGTGSIQVGRSSDTQSVELAQGATASGKTKQVLIGVNSLAGSTTNITIGSTAGTSTTTLNGTLSLANALPVGSGGTGLNTLTANYIPYGNGTSAFNSNSTFTFDGTTQSAPIQRASNGIHTNTKAIATNFTIPSTDNAMSSGPITINSGITVTVSSGSRWVVL